MRLSLKAGERIFINGAVIRSERRVTIELLNDATFLLESHVMQLADAVTPLKQLYFVIQSMLITPGTSSETKETVLKLIPAMLASYSDAEAVNSLGLVSAFVEGDKPYDALRVLRGLFHLEEEREVLEISKVA